MPKHLAHQQRPDERGQSGYRIVGPQSSGRLVVLEDGADIADVAQRGVERPEQVVQILRYVITGELDR